MMLYIIEAGWPRLTEAEREQVKALAHRPDRRGYDVVDPVFNARCESQNVILVTAHSAVK